MSDQDENPGSTAVTASALSEVEPAFAFARYRLFPRARQLFAGERAVGLGSRAFELLLALVQADGKLLTKQALHKRVWPDTVVTDHNVDIQIATVRKALGEDRDLIRTEAVRGYRLAATVRWVPAAKDLPATVVALFRRGRQTARKTLDAEPSRETRALNQAIRALPDRRDRDENAFGSTVPPRRSPRSPSHPAVSTRPRVGVLPFLAVRSPEDEGLAFSLSQEIAAALARFRWFDVIAPVSLTRGAFRASKVARRTQPDYVVDGALSRNGEHFQISVRLLDLAGEARPLWSDRFTLAASELHELEELVAARTVGQIDPIILFNEGQPRRREYHGATGLLLLAMPLMYSMQREKYERARHWIDQALEIDPENAMAWAWAAYWQVFHVGQGWAEDPAQAMASAPEHALRAIRLDPENAEALGIYAHICSFLNKDFDFAVHYFDRALRLNPSLAFIWALSASTYCYVGEPDAALRRLERYRDLAPFDPYWWLFENACTLAHAIKGDYEQAVSVGRRVATANPDFTNGYKPLIASLGHLGRRQEAERYVEKLLSMEPNFTSSVSGRSIPSSTRAIASAT